MGELSDPERSVRSRSVTTALDVARLAGVSQSAVSRAFTQGASISAAMRKRIFAAAEELGYQPNLIARSLTSGRSGLIGVGIGQLQNPFFAESLNLLAIALDKVGLRTLLFPAIDKPEVGPSGWEVLSYRLDALILISTSLSADFGSACESARVPVVLYNRRAERSDISSVIGDNYFGARCIAAHLLAGRHQRYAFIGGSSHSSTSLEREAGFTDYLVERGVEPPAKAYMDFTYDGAAAATRRLLASRDWPDAICCINDLTACAAVNVARHEFGLEVGRQISITGYDDVPLAAWPMLSLTTYRQSTHAMVDATVALVKSIIEDPTATMTKVIDGELVIRSSTRGV